jgi:predicted MPP superfamily phosphohydrolase
LANLYIYKRFFKKIFHGTRRKAAIVPLILMLGEFFFVLDVATNIIPDSPALYLITSAFVGFTFMLFVVTTFYDLTVTVSKRVPFDAERRKTLKIIFDVTMLVAAIAYLFRGLSQGVKEPVLNKVDVAIKDFPADEFHIVQLTDVHVGRTLRREFVESLVERTNQLRPDMVVITGDLVDLEIERIRDDLQPLAEIEAPTYFILGNHEYFHGVEDTVAAVEQLGIKPLLNDAEMIVTENGHFNLVGINDLMGERMGHMPHDIAAAYQNIDQSLPCVVLFHQPKGITLMDDYRCDLMLSGHTHGGQIFPFGLLVMVDQPYLAGLYQHSADKQIFVSRGTGYWGPPLRVLAPSEMSQIRITPA